VIKLRRNSKSNDGNSSLWKMLCCGNIWIIQCWFTKQLHWLILGIGHQQKFHIIFFSQLSSSILHMRAAQVLINIDRISKILILSAYFWNMLSQFYAYLWNMQDPLTSETLCFINQGSLAWKMFALPHEL